jgi:hypothetical protein
VKNAQKFPGLIEAFRFVNQPYFSASLRFKYRLQHWFSCGSTRCSGDFKGYKFFGYFGKSERWKV